MFQGLAWPSCLTPQPPLGLRICLPVQTCAPIETHWLPLLNNAAYLGNRLPDASIASAWNVSTFGPSATLSRALRRGNIRAFEEEILRLDVNQADKDMALSNCASSQQSWAARKPKLTIHAGSDSDDAPIFDPDDAARRFCQHWSGIFRARDDSTPQEQADTMLSFVKLANNDMNWTIEFSLQT